MIRWLAEGWEILRWKWVIFLAGLTFFTVVLGFDGGYNTVTVLGLAWATVFLTAVVERMP